MRKLVSSRIFLDVERGCDGETFLVEGSVYACVCARASTEAEAERDSCCSLSTKLLLFFLFFVFFFF